MYLYDAADRVLANAFRGPGAVLDCVFSRDDATAYTAGLDHALAGVDIHTEQRTPIGSHEAPVRCVENSIATGLLVTGSWDKSIRLWDARSATPEQTVLWQPGRVFALAVSGNRAVVGNSDRSVHIYDLRQTRTPEQTRESSLKNQTRAIRCFPDGQGYVLTSIEGRVAVEYFDPNPAAQKRKYAFKCHRSKQDGVPVAYPVNAVAFHPVFGTFATGGCDGMVHLWDGEHKKKITSLPRQSTSIASLDFNKTGNMLAIAASYTFEMGEVEHPADQVILHYVNEKEVMPKRIR